MYVIQIILFMFVMMLLMCTVQGEYSSLYAMKLIEDCYRITILSPHQIFDQKGVDSIQIDPINILRVETARFFYGLIRP